MASIASLAGIAFALSDIIDLRVQAIYGPKADVIKSNLIDTLGA